MAIHYRYSLLLLLLLSSVQLEMTSSAAAVLEYPCNSHDNFYPFCNSSMAISDRAQTLISLLTLPDKIKYLSNNFTGIPRLGIPPYQWWSESLHGIATNGPGISFNGSVKSATMFPQVLNSAASFNRTLWFTIASAVSVEARAMYNSAQAGLTYWAPSVNIFRDPRWGRGQETPGEDPLLASAYAINFVKGFQHQQQQGGRLMLSACCKHFTAYDLEKWANFTRYNFNALVNKQDMEDTYEPPFKSCIEDGKASCLMCSYNSVNGIPACAGGDLLQKVRKEWGFTGYVTSDCDAVATIFEYQFYAKTAEDAVADALKAGVDINCGTYMLYKTASAIEQGKVNEEDVDRALQNLISVLLRLGLFDGDPLKGAYGRLGSRDVCTKEHQRLALEAATQGIVLLKNDNNFLPLSRDGVGVSSLAVIGPGANTSTQLLGGYSGVPCKAKNYVQVLRKYVKKMSYVGGCLNVACESNSTFDEALIVAEASDYVILIFGLDLTQETEDKDRVSLLLPGKQMELILLVAAVSKRPLILVLTGGGPLDVSFAKGDPRIAGILWVGYPGEAGGKALAQVIFGDYNPGGRLPMTWYPESFAKIAMSDMNMRADLSRLYPGRSYRFYTGVPVYEFGHGLSYTNYTYKLLSVPGRLHLMKPGGSLKRELFYEKEDDRVGFGVVYIPTEELMASCEMLRFSVEISVINMGHIDGTHVVILYSKATRARKDAPRKQVVGFSRVQISAYEATETSIEVDPCTHLSFADEHGKRILPLGDHTLILGHLEHSFSIAM